MIFVLFLLVQVASLGNVIPLETAPSVLRTLNGMLPLTAYTNAASQLVSGGHIGSLLAVVLLLVVWSLGACALMVVSVKRQRLRRSSPPSRSREHVTARGLLEAESGLPERGAARSAGPARAVAKDGHADEYAGQQHDRAQTAGDVGLVADPPDVREQARDHRPDDGQCRDRSANSGALTTTSRDDSVDQQAA